MSRSFVQLHVVIYYITRNDI